MGDDVAATLRAAGSTSFGSLDNRGCKVAMQMGSTIRARARLVVVDICRARFSHASLRVARVPQWLGRARARRTGPAWRDTCRMLHARFLLKNSRATPKDVSRGGTLDI
jgi:hypothetical protein